MTNDPNDDSVQKLSVSLVERLARGEAASPVRAYMAEQAQSMARKMNELLRTTNLAAATSASQAVLAASTVPRLTNISSVNLPRFDDGGQRTIAPTPREITEMMAPPNERRSRSGLGPGLGKLIPTGTVVPVAERPSKNPTSMPSTWEAAIDAAKRAGGGAKLHVTACPKCGAALATAWRTPVGVLLEAKVRTDRIGPTPEMDHVHRSSMAIPLGTRDLGDPPLRLEDRHGLVPTPRQWIREQIRNGRRRGVPPSAR
jgi:hypothetical protein